MSRRKSLRLFKVGGYTRKPVVVALTLDMRAIAEYMARLCVGNKRCGHKPTANMLREGIKARLVRVSD